VLTGKGFNFFCKYSDMFPTTEAPGDVVHGA